VPGEVETSPQAKYAGRTYRPADLQDSSIAAKSQNFYPSSREN